MLHWFLHTDRKYTGDTRVTDVQTRYGCMVTVHIVVCVTCLLSSSLCPTNLLTDVLD